MPNAPRTNSPFGSMNRFARALPMRNTTRAGYDSKWRRFSERYRRKNPLCVKCLKRNKVRAAAHVDHIIPLDQGGEKFARENLQSLCESCHGKKTRLENLPPKQGVSTGRVDGDDR